MTGGNLWAPLLKISGSPTQKGKKKIPFKGNNSYKKTTDNSVYFNVVKIKGKYAILVDWRDHGISFNLDAQG